MGKTDQEPLQKHWHVISLTKEEILIKEYKFTRPGSTYESSKCLEDNQSYKFILQNANGDGLNDYSSYYQIFVNNNLFEETYGSPKRIDVRSQQTTICSSDGACDDSFNRRTMLTAIILNTYVNLFIFVIR